MEKRFVTIWFRYLKTDWQCRRQRELRNVPFVFSLKDGNRVIVSSANAEAEQQGIRVGMAVADARAVFPELKVLDDRAELDIQLLRSLGKYCIRYTPIVAIDPPDSLILDVTGCAHLWGSERAYVETIIIRFNQFGYDVKAAIADTIGAAWAITRFGKDTVIEKRQQEFALLYLPCDALRLEANAIQLLYSLGLRKVHHFINMPRSALRRRFGDHLIQRIDQALGRADEIISPIVIPEPYQERLPCPELISTVVGIEIALKRLLDAMCLKLLGEQKGLRKAIFKCYRIDGKVERIEIGTNHPSCNVQHLFKLLQEKIDTIEPALGIELFTLDAPRVEAVQITQQKLWAANDGLQDVKFTELLDRIANKIGEKNIHRFVPDEHYWPERSYKTSTPLNEAVTATWKTDRPRPIQILARPEPIQVTAPVPDYPPMLFRYKNKLHIIKKADGPERIEREWWLEEGLHRDYYNVEDEEGNRYWLFRLGHYTTDQKPEWFMHGFFA